MPGQQSLLNFNITLLAIIRLVGVFAFIVIGIGQTVPPKPFTPFRTRIGFFIRSRHAMHVQKIGAIPHPTGSLENEEVRQYLINQITSLGLTPEIQSALVAIPRSKQPEAIHNVIVKIPGTKPVKALMLVAHYDSVPVGPGAADDGASVAAILETLRAIKSQAPLQNDLICLFTDGEELGLLGAQAFVDQHPWAKKVGLALNFEYRGNSGAFMMFETSEGNGQLIAGLAAAAPTAQATSLMYEVYQRLPNDTDFSVFKRAGIPGMNFAAIEGHKHYHTALDRPEFLNQGTLQHEGEIMLALVKHFGNQPLDNLKAENRQYFDFTGIGLIHYPMCWTLPLCGLLAMLFVALGIAEYKSKAIRLMPTVIATAAYLLLVVGLYFIDSGLWAAVRIFHPDYDMFAYYDTFTSYCYLMGFILMNIVLVVVFYSLAKRWLKPMELYLGIGAIWLVLALLTINNGANFLFFWPLLALLISLGLIRVPYIKNHPGFKALVLLGGSAPGLLIFSQLIKNLFVGLLPSSMRFILLFLSLLLGLLMPLLERHGSTQTTEPQ